MTAQTPPLGGLIARLLDLRLSDVHVARPAQVEAYNADEQSVDVAPLIRRGYRDETGERQVEKLPVIPRVPVAFLGGGGYRVTVPIEKGDVVLLIFSEVSLDKWKDQGGDVDPLDDRQHALSDAIAIPGVRDFAHAYGSAPTDAMSIGKDGGPSIEIDGSEIRAGGGGALATKADIDALIDTFNTHKHTCGGPGNPSSIPDGTVAGPGIALPANGTSTLKGS